MLTKETPYLKDDRISFNAKKFDLTRIEISELLKVTNATTEQQKDFFGSIKAIQSRYGQVTEVVHAHIIPWSLDNFKSQGKHKITYPKSQVRDSDEPYMPYPTLEKDEYMIHTYSRFTRGNTWYLLNVILTEDKDGTIRFRRFYIRTMSKRLPPGVKC